MKTVVKMLFGSHVYGTNVPESDKDYKEVYIPDARSILLQKASRNISRSTKEVVTEKNKASDIDIESFTYHGYLKLLLENQTVAIDMLFIPQEFYTICDPTWTYIVENKDKLLSRKVTPFMGYCRRQANKYGIKGSRVNAVSKIVSLLEKFNPTDKLYVYLDSIRGFVDTTEHTKLVFPDNQVNPILHLEVCGRRVPTTIKVKEALKVYDLIWKEYGKRARQAANNDGIDWKALMHAVRVIEQTKELMLHKTITYPRPEADYLKLIRTGKVSFEEVQEVIETGIEEVEFLEATSNLPKEPHKDWVEELICIIYRRHIIKELGG